MQHDASQDEVFALLSDPATHGGAEVRRIDTHAASVFLAGERTYKVKRAVKFPFLDYSTREKRKAACEAELDVNQPFAPEIYRRVVAITRGDDCGLALGGDGEPIDYAVEMHRFDETATLDHLADRHEIYPPLADALARIVAQAHDKAPRAEADAWIEALAQYIDQNDAAFRDAPDIFRAAHVDALRQKSRAAFAHVRPLLQARGERGLIRRGHGDLHLGNIALIDGKPVPFDAIEFDPVIASGDVLYDLAFLLMDLVERGLHTAANVVLNRYLAETRRDEDLDALAALPLFLSVRAAIRAMVTAAKLKSAQDSERDAIAASATKYFRLACDAIAPPPPTLIAVGGLSGTGKSLLARSLAPEAMPCPGAVLLRSDVERKALFGIGETDKLPAEAYSEDATRTVYETLVAKAARVVAAGHSAIVDAVFARAEERALMAAIKGVRLKGLFLVADLDTRVARVGARKGDASDADAAVAQRQEAYDLGALDWEKVDAAGSAEATLARARAALNA